MKKLFIISSLFLFVTVIFLMIYNFVFREESPLEQEQPQEEVVDDEVLENSLQPEIEKNKIGFILTSPSESATLYGDDRIAYFDPSDDSLRTITQRRSNPEILIKAPLGEVRDIIWSKDQARALATLETGSIHPILIGDKKILTLPSAIDYAVWAGDGEKILYKAYDEGTGKRVIGISEYDGSASKVIAEIPFRRVSIAPLQDSILVAYWPVPDAYTESMLYTVGVISSGGPKLIYRNLYGANYSFSPDGKRVIASSTLTKGGSQITLGVMEHTGNHYQNLRIPTLVEKTVWDRDSKTIYYAQPSDIPEGSVMPNDYMQEKFLTRDTFWQVDVTTGKKKRLIALEELSEKIDATNLFLSADGTRLFFINRVNGLLYFLNL